MKLTAQQKKNIAEAEARKKRLQNKLFWEESNGGKDCAQYTLCRRVFDPVTFQSYDEHEITFNIYTDGSLSIWTDNDSGYFYQDELKYIAKAISMARKIGKTAQPKM